MAEKRAVFKRWQENPHLFGVAMLLDSNGGWVRHEDVAIVTRSLEDRLDHLEDELTNADRYVVRLNSKLEDARKTIDELGQRLIEEHDDNLALKNELTAARKTIDRYESESGIISF